MMTRFWIFATLLTGMVACSNGHDDSAVGTPGVGVASVDLDSGSVRLGSSAEGGNGGVPGDGGLDVPEQ
jgi:hypothetical protein